MRTIIISDTHLTDVFDRKKYNYLCEIIEGSDRVIIAGDFWDKYFCKFKQFTNSKWQKLFPRLLAKNAIYLYGNHDKKEWCGPKTSLFSVKQQLIYKMKAGKYDLHVEHGDRVAPDFDGRHSWVPTNKIPGYLAWVFEKTGLIIWGEDFFKKPGFRTFYAYLNNNMREWAIDNMKKNQLFICGHSHLAEFDLEEKFINIGFIRFGFGQYLIIDDDKLIPVKERYKKI